MKKTGLIILALVLSLGMMSVPMAAWATSYDPTGDPGYRPVPPSTPLVVNQGGIGDALIAPFYRAIQNSAVGPDFVGNYVSYVSIENTTNAWVAAHVRLRTGRFSIEVVDFPILLSPHDVFWFQFESTVDPTTGKVTDVKLWTNDEDTIKHSGLDQNGKITGLTYDPTTKTATIDLKNNILTQFTKLAGDTYTDPSSGNTYTYQDMNELTQGEISIIGLFELRSSDFPAGYNLNPKDNFYTVMNQLMNDKIGGPTGHASYAADPAFVGNPNLRVEAQDVGKALMGQVFIGDFSTGIYSGYAMTAIKDFRTNACGERGTIAHRDTYIRNSMANNNNTPIWPGAILYNYDPQGTTAGNPYVAPDWATDFGPTLNDGDNWLGTPTSGVDSFSLDEVDDALIKQHVESTYFNGGFGAAPHTYTIGVFTFPTKFLHYFYDGKSGLPATTRPNDDWPVGNLSEAKSVRGRMDVATDTSDIDILGKMWNTQEEPTSSTSPFFETTLPWEVNVIPFGQATYDAMQNFCYLQNLSESSPFVAGVDFPKYFAGQWMMQGFNLLGSGDPRNTSTPGAVAYNRGNYSLLSYLDNNGGMPNGLPVLSVMFDYEYAGPDGTTGYPHARNFAPSWDNPYLGEAGGQTNQ